MTPRNQTSPLFPYTTLFRSDRPDGEDLVERVDPPDRVRGTPRFGLLAQDVRMIIPGGEHHDDACARSEEHTSELQSQFHIVCRLLLEKKKHNHIHSRATSVH